MDLLEKFLKYWNISGTYGCVIVVDSIAHWILLSLSDLFGGSTSAGSSIASVVEGVARVHMDDDSIEMELALIYIDSDGMVTSICLGLNGTINSTSV